MLSVDVAEKERPPVQIVQRKRRVGNLWMDARTARIVAQEERERNKLLLKKREDLRIAKQNGKKEQLNVETFLRSRYYDYNEEQIQRLLKDSQRIEQIEMEYYLDSPEEVKDIQSYIEWVVGLLG